MAVTGLLYGAFIDHLAQKRIDIDTDTLKFALATSAYTPNLATHDFFNDVTNEVTGTGYTAGGVALSSVTWTYTAANSWGVSRANSTAYTLGQVVRPATGNGLLYMAVVAGTSGASIPTYPTVIGQTVTDGGVTWVAIGRAVYALDAADPSWASSTITARYGIIYDSTPGTAATNPLIALIDFGADISTTAGTFSVPFDALGAVAFFV